MSTGPIKRTRSRRVSSFQLPPGAAARLWQYLHQPEILLRLGLCLLVAVVCTLSTRAWRPPFEFRRQAVLPRAVAASVPFEVENEDATRQARLEAARQARLVYEHDPEPLVQLRARLQGRVVHLLQQDSYDADAWEEFLPPARDGRPLPDEAEKLLAFERFRGALEDEGALLRFEEGLAAGFEEFERRGLIRGETLLQDAGDDRNQAEIFVYPIHAPELRKVVSVSEVRVAEAQGKLRRNLEQSLHDPEVADRVVTWLERHLAEVTTLRYKQVASDLVRQEAVESVAPRMTAYRVGDILAIGGRPPEDAEFRLLEAEYRARLAQLSPLLMFERVLATLGMYAAMFTLCGLFMRFRSPELLADSRRLQQLILLAGGAVVVGYWAHNWDAAIIPLLLFAMTATIVYRQEVALLCTAVVGLVIVFSTGQGLVAFVILMAATATAVLLLRRIRSRSKLIYVGLVVGLVTALTTVGVNLVEHQYFTVQLLIDAGRFGLFGLLSGVAMSGVLPFVEDAFGVLTDLSLLELGDVAHPLLQELVRRAPGTYNHSINVASLAEAAAESIGAEGLLVRVGAYFHDIGKMLKPQYFVENQLHEGDKHASLVPAMSTLIIIAHVKDGSDLARQHHLPKPIIDFIQQHHGTTLVEFFYRRANEESSRVEAGEVDENAFRYPGPKPQSREAGILMLADAVESASRVLVEPGPARIENLVTELAMKRLLDGQLDESGLTLQEVRTIEDSLIKSLIAVYHGRVKYPEQRTA